MEIFEKQTINLLSIFIFLVELFSSVPCFDDIKHLPLEGKARISAKMNLKKRYLLLQKKQNGLDLDFNDRRDFKKVFKSPDLLDLPWLNLEKIQEITKEIPRQIADRLPGKRAMNNPKGIYFIFQI